MSLPSTELARRAELLPGGKLLARTVHNMTSLDWYLLAFHTILVTRVAVAPDSPGATTARWFAVALFTMTIALQLLCRGELLPAGKFRGLTYRILAIAAVCVSYFEMGVLLPALQPTLLDAELLWLDRVLFGETPAVLMERLLSHATSNWFGFFYYSYIWLLVLNILGTALFDRQYRRMGEMLAAAAMVGVAGHLIYILVPGVGPIAYMHFDRPIPDSFWWGQVQALVGNAGAMLDIFPSLHTAYPSMFALHAIRHRRTAPFKYIWPVSTFFALNIVFSTMFLLASEMKG